MSSNPAYIVASLLEKMASSDSDIRYMAANDLMAELSKETFLLDDSTEKKLIAAVLKMLDDSNGEVQNITVKCLVPLIKKIKESQIATIVDEICKMLASKDREGLRDIAGIGLKTVVVDFPFDNAVAGNLVKRLIPKLLAQLDSGSGQIQLDVIDILSEIFMRFGNFLNDSAEGKALQPTVLQTLVPLLDHSRAAVRKRAITCISFFVPHAKDDLFAGLVNKLIADISSKAEAGDFEKLPSLISCTAALARHSPARFAPFLKELLPLIIEYAELEDDDLREQCLQAVETFALRCPSAVNSNMTAIIKLGMDYIKYDPNYDAGDDEDEDEMEEDEEEEEDDVDQDFSDDDDVSWKVRRSAARLLTSLISTRPDMLPYFYSNVAPLLIRRFSEREETVRTDVLNTFTALLQQTAHVQVRSHKTAGVFQAAASINSQAIASLRELVPKLVKMLVKQLLGKSIPTRSAGFLLLKNLILVLEGGLDESLSAIVPAIEVSLVKSYSGQSSNTNTNLKIEVLEFLSVLLTNHQPLLFHPHVSRLVPAVLAAAKDKFYKISAEAFNAVTCLIRVLRPFDQDPMQDRPTVTEVSADALPFINLVFTATLEHIQASDTSAEVKEKVITAIGVLVYQAADLIPQDAFTNQVMPVLIERLKNETTRLTTIRALTQIADTPIADASPATLAPFANQLPLIVPEIAAQLRKAHRQLRIVSLQALETLCRRFPSPELYPIILSTLRHMLTTDSDLQVLPLALSLLIAIIQVLPADQQPAEIMNDIVPVLIDIICQTPHLVSGGSSLALLVQFWTALVAGGDNAILKSCTHGLLTKIMSPQGSKEAYPIVAKSIAALTISNAPDAAVFLQTYVANAAQDNVPDNTRYLSLLILGEIGNKRDLSQAAPSLHETLFARFGSSSEEIKNAAAFALGNVATGNPGLYLPFIVAAVRAGQHQYLSVLSLKEAISQSVSLPESRASIAPFVNEIWQLLFERAEADLEDSTRNAIAECLGLLSTADAATFLPQLQSRLTAPRPETRATVVSAIRYTFADHSSDRADYDILLEPLAIEFLRLVRDPDLNVRRIALGAVNSAAHSKSHLIRNSLGELLPLLYHETLVNESLITVVEMGPFKHKVDGGPDARKAAFECLYALLDTCLADIEIFEFIKTVQSGITDPSHEIKIISHLMLQRLAQVSPTALSTRMDASADALKDTLLSTTKSSAVKQEIEKHRELCRAAAKTLWALIGLVGNDSSIAPKLVDVLRDVRASNSVGSELVAAVEKENAAMAATTTGTNSTSAQLLINSQNHLLRGGAGSRVGGLVGASMDLSR